MRHKLNIDLATQTGATRWWRVYAVSLTKQPRPGLWRAFCAWVLR